MTESDKLISGTQEYMTFSGSDGKHQIVENPNKPQITPENAPVRSPTNAYSRAYSLSTRANIDQFKLVEDAVNKWKEGLATRPIKLNFEKVCFEVDVMTTKQERDAEYDKHVED